MMCQAAFLLLLALGFTTATQAAVMNITAEYKGSITNPKTDFVNTTPPAGYCANSTLCGAGVFGVAFPAGGTKILTATAAREPRKSFMVSFDSRPRDVTVTNERGQSFIVKFRAVGMSFLVSRVSNEAVGIREQFVQSPLYPFGSCNGNGYGGYNSNVYSTHWTSQTTTGMAVCYEPNKPELAPLTVSYSQLALQYSLTLDAPYTWPPGVYTGTGHYSFGANKDIDFGDDYTDTAGTGTGIDINFTLDVTHELFVRFPGATQGPVVADLNPENSWSNWPDRMPPYLKKELIFDFGTSGPLKLSVHCSGHYDATTQSCGIRDQNDPAGPVLPFDVFMTNARLRDSAGQALIMKKLPVTDSGALPELVSVTAGNVGLTPARLNFRTKAGVTDRMQRGHTYTGNLTVVFDANL
jgi:hypothetical protein